MRGRTRSAGTQPSGRPDLFYLLLGPGTRDSEKPPSVMPFPPIEPPEPTMTGATMSADNRNAQHRRAHRTRNTRDATARPPNPDRRRFLGISHNVPGLPNLKPGQDVCVSKRHDRAKVRRKERSDWSRQPGVSRSVAYIALARTASAMTSVYCLHICLARQRRPNGGRQSLPSFAKIFDLPDYCMKMICIEVCPMLIKI